MALSTDALIGILETANDEDLAHYGRKGMKWGVRRTPAQLARGGKNSGKDGDVSDPVRIKSTPGQKVQATGGARYRSAQDAKEVAARRQIARQSTTDALTTKQLQSVVNRMELEQKYNKLNPPKKSLGKEFAQMVFEADKKTLASTGDYTKTSTYKLGKTAIDLTSVVVKAAKKK